MAVQVAKSCRPDVLVIQGSDAGGNGLVQSSSIISLLPECADNLETAASSVFLSLRPEEL